MHTGTLYVASVIQTGRIPCMGRSVYREMIMHTRRAMYMDRTMEGNGPIPICHPNTCAGGCRHATRT